MLSSGGTPFSSIASFGGCAELIATIDGIQSGDADTLVYTLTFVDSDDQGGNYYGVWGDGTYLYAACDADGLRSYSVDGSGTLTHIDTDDQGGSYRGVTGDASYIYVACNLDGLRSYSVDGSGNLTHISTADQGGYYIAVCGDGTYIYAACDQDGLRSYSVDGSGNLTHISTADQGGFYRDAVWVAGASRLYVACGDEGLRSYMVDEFGALTYQFSANNGGFHHAVWGDGTYIYAACGDDGLRVYRDVGDGPLVGVSSDDQGGVYSAVWGDGTYIYTACGDDGLRVYSVDGSGNLTCLATDDQGGVYSAVWGDGTYIYAACGDDGLRVYSVTSASAWTPAEATDDGGFSPLAWWDASAITGLSDSDSVATLTDQTGNGNHAAQSSASYRPTYHTEQLNGLPIVRFASGQWLDLTTGIDLTAAGTVLGVVKHTGHCVIMGQAVGSGGPYICSHDVAHALDGNWALYVVPMTSHTLFTVTYDGASFVFRVSGSPVSAHSTGSSVIMTDDFTTLAKTPSWIGNCEIAELLVYDSVLSAADISQVEAYLQTKWGV